MGHLGLETPTGPIGKPAMEGRWQVAGGVKQVSGARWQEAGGRAAAVLWQQTCGAILC